MGAPLPRVTYSKLPPSEFLTDVRQRVDEYFERTGQHRIGHWLMPCKTALFLSLMVGGYVGVLSGIGGPLGGLALACVTGLSSVMLMFNTAHDASHGTYSRRPWVNHLLSHAWNLVGLSSYSWNLKHNVTHHAFPNVEQIDIDIEGGGLLRINESEPWMPLHRYQHLYALPLYCLLSLLWIFMQGPLMMLRPRWGNREIDHHPTSAWVEMIGARLFYISYSLVIPLMVLPYSTGQILLGYFIMHALMGQLMGLIAMTPHITDSVRYYSIGEDGVLDNWGVHQLEATADLAADSKFMIFISGGLNAHVAHHLFPRVSHVHIYELSKIVAACAAKHGLRYTNNSVGAAIVAHLRALRSRGQKPASRSSFSMSPDSVGGQSPS